MHHSQILLIIKSFDPMNSKNYQENIESNPKYYESKKRIGKTKVKASKYCKN